MTVRIVKWWSAARVADVTDTIRISAVAERIAPTWPASKPLACSQTGKKGSWTPDQDAGHGVEKRRAKRETVGG